MDLFNKIFKKKDVKPSNNATIEDDEFVEEDELDEIGDDGVVSINHLNLSFEKLGLLKRDFIPLPNNTDIEVNDDESLNELLIYERIVFLRNFINIFDYSWKTDDIKSILYKQNYNSGEEHQRNYKYYPFGEALLDSIYQWYHDRLKGIHVTPDLVPTELPVHLRQMYYIGLKFVDMYLSDSRSIIKPELEENVGYYAQEQHQYGYSFAVLLVGILSGTNLLPLNKKARKIAFYFNRIVKRRWESINVAGVQKVSDIENQLMFGLIALRLLHEPNWDGTLYDGSILKGVRNLFKLPEINQTEKQ